MARGKWTSEKQKDLFVAASDMPRSPGHPFYVALNKLLAEAKFDAYVEELCEPLHRDGGRLGIPPGVFFRMLFVGYFEGIDSQRGIVWRCSDSMSLRSFLGLLPTESSPDHSSLTVIRKRMPNELIEQDFASDTARRDAPRLTQLLAKNAAWVVAFGHSRWPRSIVGSGRAQLLATDHRAFWIAAA